MSTREKLFYYSLIFLFLFYFVPNNKFLVLITGVFLLGIYQLLGNITQAILYVYVFLIPFQNGKGIDFLVVPSEYVNGNIPFIMTPTISMSDIMVSLLAYLHVRRILYHIKTKEKTNSSYSDAAIAVFFITLIVSSILSDIPLLSFLLSIQLAGYIYVYYTIRLLDFKSILLSFLFPIVSSLTIYEGLWSIRQLLNKGMLGSWAENTIDPSITGSLAHVASEDHSLFRMQGTFSHPNFLGFFMAITTPVLLHYSISRYSTKFERVTASLGFALGSVGLALSASRASWLCYIAGLVLIFKPNIIRSSISLLPMIKRFYIFCIFLLLLITPILVIPRLSQFRITFDPSGGAMFRWQLITFAFQIVKQYPFGIGLGVFPKILLQEIGGFTSFPTQPHNLLAQIIVATGYIGLFSFICFICLQLIRLNLGSVRNNKISQVGYIYKISFILILILSMFYPILTEQQIFGWFWILLALVV